MGIGLYEQNLSSIITNNLKGILPYKVNSPVLNIVTFNDCDKNVNSSLDSDKLDAI